MDNRWKLGKCRPAGQSSGEPAVAVVPAADSQVQPRDSSRNSQVLTSKPFNPSSKVPVHSSSFILGPTGCEVSVASAEISLQNVDNCYLKSRTDICPVLQSRTLPSGAENAASCLHDVMQVRKVNDPSLELVKAQNYHTSHDIEQLNGFSSLEAATITTPTPTWSGKLHSSSTSHQLSPIASGFPRVFCLYASGNLFLSNNGLLGVACSCHGFHMSVSKFLEHSGLQDVNPGDAVHMDSGETIAQWRKVYFRKFGIRIPEDHCGWHWPEGFTATANLSTSSGRVPKVSRSSDLLSSSDPSRALVASKQHSNNVVFPYNPHPGQKLVNEIPCHEIVRNTPNSCTLLNGGADTRNNVHTAAARKILEVPLYGCFSMPKLVGGAHNDFQSSPKCTDQISRTKNSLSSKNLRSLGKDSVSVKCSNLRDGDMMDKATVSSDTLKFNNLRDGDLLNKATVSSNIELRLGQPSQQSQTSEKLNVPGFSNQLVSRFDRPLEFISSESLIHNVGCNRITDESRQYVNCAAQAAKSSSTGGQNLLKSSNLGFGAYSKRVPLQPGQLKADMVAGSVHSILFSHLESAKNKMQTKGSHFAGTDSHVMPKQQYSESRIPKFDSLNFGCNKGNKTEVKFGVNDLERYKLVDRDKGLGHSAATEHSPEEVNLRCHVKFMGNLSSSCRFNETRHDKSSHQQILSNTRTKESDARLTFNYPETISSLELGEHLDHGFIRPITSQPVAPRLPSRAPSILFSSMGKNSSPNMTSTMSKEEVTMVKSSHMLSSTQAVVYSNQDHVPPSCGFNKDQTISINENVKSSIALSSKTTEKRDACKFTCKDYPPEFARKSVRSGSTYWTGGCADKSAMVTVSQETSHQIRDRGLQSNLLCDPHQTGPPLPRVDTRENICSSSEHGKCCQSTSCACIPDKCSCFIPKNSINENCNLKGKKSLGTFGEQSQIRAYIPSYIDVEKDRTSLGSKSIYSGKIEDPTKPNVKKVEFNAFQWKDVPSKRSGRCHVPCKDETADILYRKTDVGNQTSGVARKCFNQPVQTADCMKEQVMSNISSKCSAPAITQASVKVSNGDSCNDDAHNTGCAKNFAFDESSGIQKSWSSDDALDSGSNTKFDGFACKMNFRNEALSKAILDQPSRSLIDELRVIDSLRLKKVQNQVHTGITTRENTSPMQQFEKDFQVGKRKREMKFKVLGTSFPASPVSSVSTGCSGQSSQSLEDLPIVVQPSEERSHHGASSIGCSSKRRRSMFPAPSAMCYKDVHKLDKSTEELSCQTPIRVYDGFSEIPEPSCGNMLRLDLTSSKTKQVCKQEMPCKRLTRPVVCGRYGLISNGDTSKLAKIVSLGRILKVARRCGSAGKKVVKKSAAKAFKKSVINEGNRRSSRIANIYENKSHVSKQPAVFGDIDPMNSPGETEMTCSPRWAKDDDTSYMLEKGKDCINEKSHGTPDIDSGTGIKRKSKEVRKRSLYELITTGKDSSSATILKNRTSPPQDNLNNNEDGNTLVGVDNAYRSHEELKYRSTPGVNTLCNVCGSINNDEMNCLLECNRCLIRVHQACYGISKVPKGYWHCRPCKENATNIVCVLCGYEGGVMTRAIHSSNIVKSLLIAWNVITESLENPIMSSLVLEGQLMNADAPSEIQVDIDAPQDTIPEHIKASSVADTVMKNSSRCINDTMVLNSVTAGILDSTVKQWVHMVCGLWTAGTRCPNVNTMSTFDVSGACHPKGNVVCSLCKRRGGCCIRCRVVDCAVHFHPWCAHQKGLLQSEVEGADNDKVGFYGKCELHATEDHCNHNADSHGIQTICTHEKETCARTEGFKGRKREGFRHDSQQPSGACLVRQEQIDAWDHINRQMSFRKRLKKPPVQPIQDIEYDCRKEYARYKQSKGWNHLVVFKSGIHALGLYTSLFLSQGAMVVEYVGEIVGLRVADRREVEYQSGKKLQYKSACYFFRIDKEHIIDATRKGGIARFVNHSCQPNCVAKVITVRGEKKVVFFAERDIYPGEEITYDYHFNNEDEGKKILCSCNSKNCRRYLN